MGNKCIFLIFIFGAPLLVSVASAQTTKLFQLPVSAPWFDTGISVGIGETVTITASGSVYIGALNPSSLDYQTPAGSPGSTPRSIAAIVPFLAPGLPLWSLIGRIGSSGTPFEVGSNSTFIVNTAGELYLSMNDNNFADNSGTWSVTITNAGVSSKIAITAVTFSDVVGQNVRIDIKGTGFGSAPVSMPYSGNLQQFSFNDNTTHEDRTQVSFEAGHAGDAVFLNYSSWTDKEIVIDGFSGAYGYGAWYVSPGDVITIRVSQVNSNDNSSQKATWHGTLPVAPSKIATAEGMGVSGVTSSYQAGTIQSIQSYTPPFKVQAKVMGTISYGRPFELAIASVDGANGVTISANLNAATGYLGIWDGWSTGAGSPWSGSGFPFISSPTINTWYDLIISVDTGGHAMLEVDSLATRTALNGALHLTSKICTYQNTNMYYVGNGPFYVLLVQREGAPYVSGPNQAYWHNITVTAGLSNQQTLLKDDFTQDVQLNSDLWEINGPVGNVVGRYLSNPPSTIMAPTIEFSQASQPPSNSSGKPVLQVIGPPVVNTTKVYQTLVLSVSPGPSWPTRSTQPAYNIMGKLTYLNVIAGTAVPVLGWPFTIAVQVRNVSASNLPCPKLVGTPTGKDALGQSAGFEYEPISSEETIKSGQTVTLTYQVVASWNTFKPPSNLLEPTSTEHELSETAETALSAEENFVTLYSGENVPSVSAILMAVNSLSAATRLIGMKVAPIMVYSFHLEGSDYAIADPFLSSETVAVEWEPYKMDVLTAYLVDAFVNIIPDPVPDLSEMIENLRSSPHVASILSRYSVMDNLGWYERALEQTLPYDVTAEPPPYEVLSPSFQGQ